MADDKNQSALNDQLAKVNAEANGIFAKMGSLVDEQAKQGGTLDVLKITKTLGLEIDEKTLHELKINRIILCHPWLPWHCWFPWRPFWCWWWHRYYPWYTCCPWWWYRCHWYPL